MKKLIVEFWNSTATIFIFIRFLIIQIFTQYFLTLFITTLIFPLLGVNGPSLLYSRLYALFAILISVLTFILLKMVVFRSKGGKIFLMLVKYFIAVLILTIINGMLSSLVLSTCASNISDIQSLAACKNGLYPSIFGLVVGGNFIISFFVLKKYVFNK